MDIPIVWVWGSKWLMYTTFCFFYLFIYITKQTIRIISKKRVFCQEISLVFGIFVFLYYFGLFGIWSTIKNDEKKEHPKALPNVFNLL